MGAYLQCGSCRYFKEFIDHPKYGTVEIDHKKNGELMAKIMDEAWQESRQIAYAMCVIGYLDKARKRVNNGYMCDRYTSATRHCPHCGEIIDTGF